MLEAIFNSMPGAIAQGLIWAILAIGVYITFKILNFADLTVDGSICTGACVATICIVNGWNPVLAVLMAFLAGCLAGLLTGVFHTLLGIPPILSGILTQLILWSVNLKILGSANVALPARELPLILSALNIPMAILYSAIFVVVIIIILYFFFNSEVGYSIVATGCNLDMSRAQGINVNFTIIIGLMLSNGIVAISGALLAQYQGFADINMGRGAIVIGLAAVIIGQALVSKIHKKLVIQLLGITVGSIIYYLIYTLIIQLGCDTDLLKMLSAILVAIFLAIPFWKNKYVSYRRRKKAC